MNQAAGRTGLSVINPRRLVRLMILALIVAATPLATRAAERDDAAATDKPGAAQTQARARDLRVLVFSKTLGFRHANIPLGVSAIRQLGAENMFTVDATEDSGVFTVTNLARYKAVVFLSTTGDVLNAEQEKALQDYILGGGGFAAIHGALFGPSACEEHWGWYGDLCCAAFKNHSAVVPASVAIEDPVNPSTEGLPQRWSRTDEWYNYEGTPRGKARVLATVDETTYTGGNVGEDHPIAWCRQVGRGVMWYTAMGHTDESFREPLFLKHVLGGIQLAAGLRAADLAPNSRKKVQP
jgi:cytochrome c